MNTYYVRVSTLSGSWTLETVQATTYHLAEDGLLTFRDPIPGSVGGYRVVAAYNSRYWLRFEEQPRPNKAYDTRNAYPQDRPN